MLSAKTAKSTEKDEKDEKEPPKKKLSFSRSRSATVLRKFLKGEHVDEEPSWKSRATLKISELESLRKSKAADISTMKAVLLAIGNDTQDDRLVAQKVFVWLCGSNQLLLIEYMMQGYSCLRDSKDELGNTPILAAAAAGHCKLVIFLHQFGFSLEGINEDVQDICLLALSKNSVDILNYLYRIQYRVVRKCVDKVTKKIKELIPATNRELHSAANIFLMQTTMDNDLSKLLIASTNHELDIVYSMLRADSSLVNQQDKYGNTALIYAASNGHLDVIIVLRTIGAEHRSNAFGVTPLLAAIIAGHTHIVQFFINEGCCELSDERLANYDIVTITGMIQVQSRNDIQQLVRKSALSATCSNNNWSNATFKPTGRTFTLPATISDKIFSGIRTGLETNGEDAVIFNISRCNFNQAIAKKIIDVINKDKIPRVYVLQCTYTELSEAKVAALVQLYNANVFNEFDCTASGFTNQSVYNFLIGTANSKNNKCQKIKFNKNHITQICKLYFSVFCHGSRNIFYADFEKDGNNLKENADILTLIAKEEKFISFCDLQTILNFCKLVFTLHGVELLEKLAKTSLEKEIKRIPPETVMRQNSIAKELLAEISSNTFSNAIPRIICQSVDYLTKGDVNSAKASIAEFYGCLLVNSQKNRFVMELLSTHLKKAYKESGHFNENDIEANIVRSYLFNVIQSVVNRYNNEHTELSKRSLVMRLSQSLTKSEHAEAIVCWQLNGRSGTVPILKADEIVEYGKGKKKIDDTTIPALLKTLRGRVTLVNLELQKNNLTVNGLISVLKTIKQYIPLLQRLDLTDNPLGEGAGIEFKNYLANTYSLKELCLYNVKLGCGLVELAAGILENKSLESINLSQNKLTNESIIPLIYALGEHRNIKEIRLNNNNFTDEIVQPIIDLLKKRRNIIRFDMHDCGLSDSSLSTLKECFEKRHERRTNPMLGSSRLGNLVK